MQYAVQSQQAMAFASHATGASSVPHAALGSARRMEVGNPIEQHVLLNQAVLGHAPEVLVVDEILTHKVSCLHT
jgi:stage III sporulation protein SpoIIIAA